MKRRRESEDFVENLLDRALSDAKLPPADRGFCQELVYGVVRWQAALDWLIMRKTQGRTQKADLQDLLRLGLYQIFWLDRIPAHAAVHETVELAKRGGLGAQAGFVNALLRNYLREVDATKQALTELKNEQPHAGWSHPDWLVARWKKLWGPEKTAQLLEWNNTPPKTFVRVNLLKADPAKLIEQWRAENVDYDFVSRDWLDENSVFEFKSHPALGALPSFQQGKFYIQDPSTLLAVRELDPQPREAILDLCAAPGGKMTFIAQRMNDEGHIVACDTSEARLDLLRENCARLGVTCVEPIRMHEPAPDRTTGPRSSAPDLHSRQFDRVLVDAPCSNTGVMRRRVELRWRIQPPAIERLRAVQLDLLRQAALRLRPGGTMVYSTCSLEPEENGSVVDEFLAEQKHFTRESWRELLPFADRVDGAFVARLKRH